MVRILVADKIAEEGLALLRRESGVTFDVRHGLSPGQLGEIVGDYDGMLIRSGVKVTAETLAKSGRLGVIARAGVGVDNVDLDAATAAGVLVLNTPDANTISTAEHTLAMMLALHRRIPTAHEHVRQGLWNRSAFQGDQMAGRTLGIVGFGRIGRAVAQRALSFHMKVIAYDPFLRESNALNGAVTMLPKLDDLLRQADCVTLHASLSEDTRHLIGASQLALMKRGAKLINCARGALVDEAALADALNAGHLGGAAVDVYENEPPLGSPLLTSKNVVLTPHLAASTTEAQTQVSIEAVETLLAFLLHGEIRSAVNVTGLPSRLSARARAYLDLGARIGTMLSVWCSKGVERVGVTTYGDTLEDLGGTLSWQALVSVLSPHLASRLTMVNARDQARQRGITVEHGAHSSQPRFPESVLVSIQSQGQEHTIEGTVLADGRPRVLSIDDYRMEIVPERSMALIFNDDQPGVIGLVGKKFGDAGINIADMALSRRGKMALMVLKLDTPMPENLRKDLRAATPPIVSVHAVTLPPAAEGPTPG